MTIELTPLERNSTVAQVARILREGIIGGRVEVGAQLRIAVIAEMLQTSQGTVREAIRELVQEGLVVHRLHRGSFVRVPSERDSLDVYVAREVIETWAAGKVVESRENLDFAIIEAAISRMRTEDPEDEHPTSAVIDADMEFHHGLVCLAGSERLIAVHKTLVAETKILIRVRSPWPGRSYEPIHQQILDSLVRKDPNAPALVSRHLRMASQLIGIPSGEYGHERDQANLLPGHDEEAPL
ncbi:MAG: GntR family transcriptional regulator [Gemmatimonadota bacterium]